jgi:hypothetical protein
MADVAPGKKMRLQRIRLKRQSRLHRSDATIDNESDRNPPEAHSNQFGKGHRSIGNLGAKPYPKEIGEDEHQHDADNSGNADENEGDKVHRWID